MQQATSKAAVAIEQPPIVVLYEKRNSNGRSRSFVHSIAIINTLTSSRQGKQRILIRKLKNGL